MDGKEKNKETILTLTTNNTNTINSNEINFSYDELKKHLYTYKKELYNNLEINFDEIMKNYVGISTLILSKKNNPTLDLMNDIILSIKSIEQYKNFPYEKIYKDLENYYKNKIRKKKRNIEIEKIKEKFYKKLYNNTKKFIIGIYTLRRNKSFSIERKINKLNCNESSEKKFKKSSNIKSKKNLFDKYKFQFEKNLDELYNEGKITYIEKINYKEFILLMKKNGYLNLEEKENEINLAKQIFDFLQYNKMEKYIPVKNLFLFTLSILNLNHNNDNIEEENIKISKKSLNLKSFDSSNSSTFSINKISNNFNLNFFFINPNQSKKIFNEYNILYYNWKKNQTNLTNNINKNFLIEQNFNFKPILNNSFFNTNNKKDFFSHISKHQNIKRVNNNLLNKNLQIESQKCMLRNDKIDNINKPFVKYLSGKNQIKLKNKSTKSPNKDYCGKITFTKNNTINNIQRIRNKSFKEIQQLKNKSLIRIKSNKSLQKILFPNKNNNKDINDIEKKYCITENDINQYKSRNIQNNNRNFHHKNYSFDNFNKVNKKIKANKLIKRNKVNIIKKNISNSNIKKYNSFSNSQNNLMDKPLFILDINLINKNKKIYIYKDINVDKTISDFVNENKIDDPQKVEFIKRLIYSEMEKFN